MNYDVLDNNPTANIEQVTNTSSRQLQVILSNGIHWHARIADITLRVLGVIAAYHQKVKASFDNTVTNLWEESFQFALGRSVLDGKRKIEILHWLLLQPDNYRRQVAMEAARRAMNPMGRFVNQFNHGYIIPDDWTPRTWEELYDYKFGIIDILFQLNRSSTSQINELDDLVLQSLSLPPFEPNRAFDVYERLIDQYKKSNRPLAPIEVSLRNLLGGYNNKSENDNKIVFDELLEEILDNSFSNNLRRYLLNDSIVMSEYLGPRRFDKLESDEIKEFEKYHNERIIELAESAILNQINKSDLEFFLDEEQADQYYISKFFFYLANVDQAYIYLSEIIERINQMRGLRALSNYLQGVLQADTKHEDVYQLVKSFSVENPKRYSDIIFGVVQTIQRTFPESKQLILDLIANHKFVPDYFALQQINFTSDEINELLTSKSLRYSMEGTLLALRIIESQIKNDPSMIGTFVHTIKPYFRQMPHYFEVNTKYIFSYNHPNRKLWETWVALGFLYAKYHTNLLIFTCLRWSRTLSPTVDVLDLNKGREKNPLDLLIHLTKIAPEQTWGLASASLMRTDEKQISPSHIRFAELTKYIDESFLLSWISKDKTRIQMMARLLHIPDERIDGFIATFIETYGSDESIMRMIISNYQSALPFEEVSIVDESGIEISTLNRTIPLVKKIDEWLNNEPGPKISLWCLEAKRRLIANSST